jgi:hypothetical protein
LVIGVDLFSEGDLAAAIRGEVNRRCLAGAFYLVYLFFFQNVPDANFALLIHATSVLEGHLCVVVRIRIVEILVLEFLEAHDFSNRVTLFDAFVLVAAIADAQLQFFVLVSAIPVHPEDQKNRVPVFRIRQVLNIKFYPFASPRSPSQHGLEIFF